jgi:hypothetical protein
MGALANCLAPKFKSALTKVNTKILSRPPIWCITGPGLEAEKDPRQMGAEMAISISRLAQLAGDEAPGRKPSHSRAGVKACQYDGKGANSERRLMLQ